MAAKTENGLNRRLPFLLSIGGVIGFIAAFDLAIEKIEILKNPAFEPSCNINPVLSCGSVMITPQAEAFGFPNPLIGIAGFAVLTTIGIALLAGGVFKRWFWVATQLGVLFAVVFVHWLIFQSIYRIGALCPYCMVVWSVTIPIFWYVTLYNLKQGNIRTPAKLKGVVNFAQKHHGDILLIWFLIIFALILERFWYYWSTLL